MYYIKKNILYQKKCIISKKNVLYQKSKNIFYLYF